jgi:hypothetical protein
VVLRNIKHLGLKNWMCSYRLCVIPTSKDPHGHHLPRISYRPISNCHVCSTLKYSTFPRPPLSHNRDRGHYVWRGASKFTSPGWRIERPISPMTLDRDPLILKVCWFAAFRQSGYQLHVSFQGHHSSHKRNVQRMNHLTTPHNSSQPLKTPFPFLLCSPSARTQLSLP